MIIQVKQSKAELKNLFEIFINNELIYKGETPFLSIKGTFSLEKLRGVKLYDIQNNLILKTDYKYLESKKEELLPFKYAFKISQKFNICSLLDNNNEEKAIFYDRYDEILNNYNEINIGGILYKLYSISNGYYTNICVYNNELQIAEIVKLNIVTDGKDEYTLFLKEDYEQISKYLIMFILYLDLTKYNSSYLLERGTKFSKEYTFSKVNKYYNKDWISQNFDANNFYLKNNKIINETQKSFKKLLLILSIVLGSIFIILIVVLLLILILLQK